uniref:Putative acetyltransferase n=1 Tax=Aegilops tauschii TaxID=37682 RepID=R7W5P9_AEGTA
MPPPSPVRVVSSRTVKPPARPRERIPLASWDVSMINANYIQKGLLFPAPPPPFSTGAAVTSHLADALAEALGGDYYPVAGRFVTDRHRDDSGAVVGCSVSIDCDGQGVEVIHAVADGVVADDVVPLDADVPSIVEDLFLLNDAINYDGHELPLFAAQVTELADGSVFVGFVCNHALADGTAFWNFLKTLAEISRARLLARGGHGRAAAAVGCAVAANTNASIRARVAAWTADPVVTVRLTMMGGSPWFDAYGCDFGWGKPTAVRSGRANKNDGRTVLYPGREGGGSVDAEVSLSPEHMAALELDDELRAAVSSSRANFVSL